MTLGPPPLYVCLPRQLLLAGPIRAREAPLKDGLSISEFCLGAAAARLARELMERERHSHAYAAGAAAIKKHRSKSLITTDDYRAAEQFSDAGNTGYFKGRMEFVANKRGYLVRTSGRKLYTLAGLSRNGEAFAQMPAALDRLAMPVCGFPPCLKDWWQTSSGRLRLQVAPQWTPPVKFARVPWPPPQQGAIELALYLFALAADPREQVSIALDRLKPLVSYCARSDSEVRRNLFRALESVNRHLRAFETGVLSADGISTSYDLLWLDEAARVSIRPNKIDTEETDDERFRRAYRLEIMERLKS